MGIVDAVQSCFNKYANGNGRARRSEFWYWELFYFLIMMVASIISNMADMPAISGIVSLAFLCPSVAVAVRRLHDIGKSGWFYLLGFIPVIGTIILIIWYVKDSQPGSNQYGPNPKGIGW